MGLNAATVRHGRIEGAAQEGQRRDHQHRKDLQLLEVLRPYPNRESEQAEAGGDAEQEQEHGGGMVDADRHEQQGGHKRDQRQNDGLGDRRADIGEDGLKARDRS